MMHYEHRTINDVWDGTDTLHDVAFDDDAPCVESWDVVIDADGTITGVVMNDNTVMTIDLDSSCYVECDGLYCDEGGDGYDD